MADSTQDVTVMAKVQGEIYERLSKLTVVDFQFSSSYVQSFNSNIITYFFDSANNIKQHFDVCYNSLQAHFKRKNPDLIQTYIIFGINYMRHILNLVVADSTVNLVQTENLFGLAEKLAIFLKRMAIWDKETKQKHHAHD